MSTNVPKELEIHVFPGQSNSYNLYEDDGITNNYQKGNYSITNIDYKPVKLYTIYAPTNYQKGIINITKT